MSRTYDSKHRKAEIIFLKNLHLGPLQNGEISEMREAPMLLGDNGLYLLVTRVIRLWSKWSWPACTTRFYCLIYCNPFWVSWSRIHMYSPWLTCSIRTDVAKRSYDCPCWWPVVVVLLSINNFSLCLLNSNKTIPHICWSLCSKPLFEEAVLFTWIYRQIIDGSISILGG